MRYIIQVETDLILEFEPWEGCVADEYAEQVGYDAVHRLNYADSQVSIDHISVETRKKNRI